LVIGYTAGKMWKNVERMSGSKMWENQIAGYSDIQKCGKMMSNGCLWMISPTFFDTRVFSLILFFLLLIVVYAARSLIV